MLLGGCTIVQCMCERGILCGVPRLDGQSISRMFYIARCTAVNIVLIVVYNYHNKWPVLYYIFDFIVYLVSFYYKLHPEQILTLNFLLNLTTPSSITVVNHYKLQKWDSNPRAHKFNSFDYCELGGKRLFHFILLSDFFFNWKINIPSFNIVYFCTLCYGIIK